MKKFILKHYKAIALTIVSIIAVVAIGRYNEEKKKVLDLTAEKVLLENKVDSFRNKNGDLVLQIEDAQFASDKYIKELSNAVFDLKRKNAKLVKKVNYFGQISQNIQIDSVLIPYTDTTYIVQNMDSFIKVPKEFNINTDEYSIGGQVKLKGVFIEKINLLDTISFRSVEQSNGWFKGNTTVVQVVNTNSNVKLTGITSMSVKNQKSEWDLWIKPSIAAILGGAVIYYITK